MAAPHASPEPGRSPDAGTGGGWRAFLGCSVPAFCWEFLRRNPDYRSNFAAMARGDAVLQDGWGLAAPADPDLSANDAAVVWRADAAPALVVPMEHRSFGRPRATVLDRGTLVGQGSERHVRLPSGLQVHLRGEAAPAGPLVIVLGYDADFALRVRAVEALRRADHTDAPPRSRLSAAQRERLARALVALDGVQRGETYRDIACELFGDHDDLGDFKGSSLRDVTIRLVRRGRALMRGGYLKLLRGGF